ncbi:MAG: SH3 domain-containing protein [Chloroflexi bacterium]|nr:SH3 domain-containing protein [Chloroflexota bacterium]
MLTKIRTIIISALMLIVLMTMAACSEKDTKSALQTVEAELIALTITANAQSTPELSVEESVALTVAASNVTPTLSIDEIVALTVAASNAQPTDGDDNSGDTAPDIADPNSDIQPIQPVSDPNTASGTPQLRVVLSSVNVRSGPGTNYPPISALLKDSVVNVIAKNKNGSWFLIELPGGSQGWIAGSVTDPVVAADMAKVQVATNIPAPPSSTPTLTATATATAVATTTATAVSTTNSPTHTPTPAITLESPPPIPSTIQIANNSGVDICYVFTAPSDGDFGDNLLQNGAVLSNGTTQSFTYPDAGPYDVAAIECDGGNNEIWDKYDNFNDLNWVIESVVSAIQITNNSGVDICYVLTGPTDPGGTVYGANQLQDEIFNNGTTRTFSFSGAGPYDVYAQQCGMDNWYWEIYNNFGDIPWELRDGDQLN